MKLAKLFLLLFCLGCTFAAFSQVQMEKPRPVQKVNPQSRQIQKHVNKSGDEPYFAFNNDIAVVYKNGKYGLLNAKRQLIVPYIYEYLQRTYYKEHYFIAKKDDRTGIIDRAGGITIPFIYEDIFDYGNHDDPFIIVKSNGKYGIINYKTTEITNQIKYDSIIGLHHCHENVVFGKLDDKYGLIDVVTGIEKTKFIYDDILQKYNIQSSDLFPVKFQEKWGVIDPTGNTVCNFVFDNIEKVGIGYVVAIIDGKHGAVRVSTGNKALIPFEYQYIRLNSFNNNLGYGAVVKKENKFGYYYSSSQFSSEPLGILVPCKYDSITPTNENYIIAQADGETYYYDFSGKVYKDKSEIIK